MKFLVTNDWHLSSRAPSSRLDNYQDELFELLDQIQALAIKIHAHIVVPGDIFHTAGGVSWALFARLMEWLQKLKNRSLLVLAIPGNHDLKFNRLDTLDDLPLGVLFRMGLLKDVSYHPTTIDGVTFLGVPFPDSREFANFGKAAGALAIEPPAVLLTHWFASPLGGEHFGEPVWRYSDLAPLPFDVFCFGHDHTDGGVVEVDGKTFINLGALSRGSIAHDDVTRDIRVALVEVDGYQGYIETEKPRPTTVQLIRLKHRPASELFDLTRKAQLDAEKQQIEQFVETLDTQLSAMAAPTDQLSDRVDQLGLGNAVRERVLTYLEQTSS